MIDINIECPHCHGAFPLTTALAAPLLEAERQRTSEAVKRELAAEHERIHASARAEVESVQAKAEETLSQAKTQQEAQMAASKQAELEALKAKEAAEQAQRDIDLSVQRQVNDRRAEIELQAQARAEASAMVQVQAAEAKLAEQQVHIEAAKKAESAALKAKQEAEQARRDVELVVQRRVDAQRQQVEREADARAQSVMGARLQDANTALAAKDVKLRQAEQAEIEARRLKAEAEDAMRQAEVLVARRLDEERKKVRDSALRERDDEVRLKVAEKDKQLDDMRRQIEELRRKGSSGSQQLAGDVLEMDLLVVLSQQFPGDHFERVSKGQSGGDVLHQVKSPGGAHCGTILWETKRTKNWQDGWLPKLRADQAAIKADIAALASETLPEGVTTFAECDKVWVTSLPAVLPMAALLRHALVEVARTRHVNNIKDSTKDKVLTYLSTPRFRQCMSLVVEGYTELRQDLDKERRTTTAMWAKRDKHMGKVLDGMSGLYGDLQGIVGRTLPAVEGLVIEHESDPPRLAVVGSDLTTDDNATEG